MSTEEIPPYLASYLDQM